MVDISQLRGCQKSWDLGVEFEMLTPLYLFIASLKDLKCLQVPQGLLCSVAVKATVAKDSKAIKDVETGLGSR